MRKKISLLLFFLAGTLALRAQGIYRQSFNAPWLLLYKLNAEQMRFVMNHPDRMDSSFLYTYLAGKVHSDSLIPLRKKPMDGMPVHPFTDENKYRKYQNRFHVWDIKENGYFIEVSATLYNVNYRLIENPLFNAGVHKIGFETFIFVEDTAGLPVYNATVHLDTSLCLFDSSVGGYRIPGNQIFGKLKIERNGIFTITHLNGYYDKQNNTAPPRDRYNYSKIPYQGYLVTNKPRYKPWDTVFFKAFVVNKKGKPLREKLLFRLSQNYTGHGKELLLKPEVRGDYSGFFVLTDSFVIDQSLNLVMMNEKRREIRSQYIMLENYELRDLQFSFLADKNEVTPGSGVRFYASVTTANHLPVMDGVLRLKLYLTNVNFTDGDSVVITNKKWNSWYEISMQTDPSGVTVFDVPDSVFIPLDGNFNAQCTLITSDNETQKREVSFYYKTTRDRQEASLKEDTLHVLRLYNNISTRRKMRIKIYSRNDLLADSVFFTPFHQYLPTNVYNAQIYRGDTLTATFYRQTSLPEVSGNRTHDSVHIHFVSHKDIPVFYRIYANNKIVASGRNTELHYHARNTEKESYHLQYGILEGSVTTPRFYSRSFHLAERKVNIQITHPATIYPGQEVAVQLRITDAWGKPLNKVNLAAWAVNTQLEGIVTPNVPYLGLVKPQKPLPTRQFPVVRATVQTQTPVKAWQVPAFRLRDNAMFRLAYPEKGFQVLKDTTPRKSTEIEFYSHGLGAMEGIQWVKKDGELFWIPGKSHPMVQRIEPGTYHFEVRTYDRIFSFRNVQIENGKKHFLCLHTDSLKILKTGDSAGAGQFSLTEARMLAERTLFFRLNEYLQDTFIVSVNHKIIRAFPFGSQMSYQLPWAQVKTQLFTPGKQNNRYTNYESFMMMVPFKDGDWVELQWKKGYAHEFRFTPNTVHSFTQTEHITDAPADLLQAYKLFGFAATYGIQTNHFWFDPLFKDTTKLPVPPKYEPEPYQPYRPDLPEYQYRNYYPQQYIYQNNSTLNHNLNLYIQYEYNPTRIWLFHNTDSVLSLLENGYSFQYNHRDVGLSSRRNLHLYTRTKGRCAYTLVMQIDDSLWLVKPLITDSSANTFLKIQPKEFRRLTRREHLLFDRLAKNLSKEPLRNWKDTPTVNNGLFILPVKSKDGKSNIEGTVTGPAITYTVDNAFVVLEKQGTFVRGAFTNSEGRFVMENLQPGLYMLKIKADEYHYWIHYALEIKPGIQHLIHVSMKPHSEYNVKVAYDVAEGTADGMAVEADRVSPSYAPQVSEKYSRSSMALSQSNVSVMKKAAGISIRGSRADGNAATIDGIRVKNKAEVAYARKPEFKAWDEEEQEKEADRLDELAANPEARKTRKDFRDYAFWKPNFYTNRDGRAGFTVKYPDNITSWRMFVPAMDGKRHSGLGDMTIRSYKPVTSTLAMPAFLNEGDSVLCFSRTFNYTGLTLPGALRFGGKKAQELHLGNYHTDSLWLSGKIPGDTLSLETAFEMPNGYRDAEMRSLDVRAATILSGQSRFFEWTSDSTITLAPQAGDLGMEIAVYNQNLAMVLEMLKKAESLPAWDNRSAAQFLQVLLLKKRLCEWLNMPFTQDRQIRETMSRLKKAQGNDGTWSWWGKGSGDYTVTTTAAIAMYRAQLQGFDNNSWLNAARYMQKNITATWGSTRLEYLLCLHQMERKADYDSLIKTMVPEKMDQTEWLEYQLLTARLGRKVPVDATDRLLIPSANGNLYVQGTWNWRCAPVTDDAANTFRAWQLMYMAGAHTVKRKALVDYLITECTSPANAWIYGVEAMMAEARRDSGISKGLNCTLVANGKTFQNANMPAIFRLKPGETLKLEHRGAPVYVAWNRSFRTYAPVSDPNQFKITTETPEHNTAYLKTATALNLKVKVFAARDHYNAVAEIPIPAGTVYGQKIRFESPYESHREYLNDRVLIFFEHLPFGNHSFTIPLVTKFQGSFHTAPSRAALQFYPDRAGYTPAGNWCILR
ncbi:MAG: hypothetical protein JNL57_02185 [Bacteroidetes bacterium]|nr:hypothetical protein [Bacteroidota bacterium]